MKRWSKLVALLLLALWLPATMHCDLEAAGLDALAHGGHGDHADHGSSPCQNDCATDSCHTVEGYSFTKAVNPLRALPPPVLTLCSLLLLVPPAPLEPGMAAPREGADDTDLLVLHRTWSFAHRAALPARAPDRLV